MEIPCATRKAIPKLVFFLVYIVRISFYQNMSKLIQIALKSSSSLVKRPKLIPMQRNFTKHVKVGKDWRDLLDTWSVHEIVRKRPFVAVRL